MIPASSVGSYGSSQSSLLLTTKYALQEMDRQREYFAAMGSSAVRMTSIARYSQVDIYI